MLNAKALLDAGRLTEAIGELTAAVKAAPADVTLRVFLFELLCFQGALDRAAKQLEVIRMRSGDAGTELALQVYLELLQGEARRREVFRGDGLPKFISTPSPYVQPYVLLLHAAAQGDEVASAVEAAEAELPAIAGTINGRPFASFRDADDRVAGVLEVIHDAEYLWVPFDQIVRLEIAPPKRLRELMWARARLEMIDQPIGDVFVPSLYVDSFRHASEDVQLGRTTEWSVTGDAMVTGAGLRTFLVDEERVAVPDVGAVVFERRGAEVQG